MNKQIHITGDPFVDNGALAKFYLADRLKKNNDLDLIEYGCDIFVDRWKAKINSLVLNSKITQPAFKPPQKKEKTKEFYQSLSEPSQADAFGFCRICGYEGGLFRAGRDIFSLTGSGDYANFHHGHESGLMLCVQCITKLFFLPFSVVQMGTKLAMLQLNSPNIREFWLKKTVQANFISIGNNSSDGILKSKFANPKNALFDLAKNIIETLGTEQPSEFLELYHFTNFAASPECEIYRLPGPVFIFLNFVLKHYKQGWYNFVRVYYRISGASWQDESESWQRSGKDKSLLETSEYRNNPNLIYEKLLAGESIVSFFIGYTRRRYQKCLSGIDIRIVRIYLKEVMRMEKERVRVVMRITNDILEMAKKEDAVKKYLNKLQEPQNAYQLRNTLVWMIKRHYRLHPDDSQPLVTLDEYMDFLFPPGQFWSEIRDLMLIFFYQRLHEDNIRLNPEDDKSK